MAYHIYTIQNKINLKIYVGQAHDPFSRWGRHKKTAQLLSHNIQIIHRAMAKYGIKNFEFNVLESHDTKQEVNEAEIFWISYLQSRIFQHGYNVTIGGDGLGAGSDNPFYGKHLSPETEFKKGQIPLNKIFNKEQEQIICKQYIEDNLSTTEIAEQYDCHRTVIIRLLERNNIDMRNRGYYSIGKSPSNKLFSIEQEQEICAKYQNEKISTTKLGEIYNCDRTVISDTLNKYNINIKSSGELHKNKPNLKHRRFDIETELAICKAYNEDNLSSCKLAKIYKCDRSTISDILKRNGFTTKPLGYHMKGAVPHNKLFDDVIEQEICNKYISNNLTLAALGREYGCDPATVRKALEKHNIIKSRGIDD